jgi:hypothetical protein
LEGEKICPTFAPAKQKKLKQNNQILTTKKTTL